MDKIKATDLYKSGRENWNRWASENLGADLSFNNMEFHDANFDRFIFPGGVDFSNCRFIGGASFINARFSGTADFTNIRTTGPLNFNYAHCDKALNLRESEILFDVYFKNVVFSDFLDLSKTVFHKEFNINHAIFKSRVTLDGTRFRSKVNFESSQFFGNIVITETNFDGGHTDANFCNCLFAKHAVFKGEFKNLDLSKSYCQNIDIRGSRFSNCNFTHTNLINANVNTETFFENSAMTLCLIERHTLECLKDYGGLTVGDRSVMNIEDGTATLRSSFSGFLSIIHITALLLFLTPYIWFILENWPQATFQQESENYISLFKALCLFIWNGGQNLSGGKFIIHPSFFLFLFMLSYNLARAVLLWKTKKLEQYQNTTGLQPIFSLCSTKWGIFYKVTHVGLWVNWIVVLVNTWYFLLRQVPLDSL